MAGIDPALAAALTAAVNAADTAFLQSALTFPGVPPDVLQAQISTGDLLAATILPPRAGVDLIEILGVQVPAQLPPDVRPGETIVLQVTAFQGNQILVRNLGPYDPQNPVALSTVTLPEGTPAAPQQTAVLTSRSTPGTPPQPVAPPREVFVAASVRAPAQSAGAAASAAPAAPAAPQDEPVKADAALQSIDARIAASQSSRATPAQQAAPAAPPAPAGRAPSPAASVPIIVQSAQSVQRSVSQVVRTAADLLRAVHLPDNAFTRTVAAISPLAPQRLAPVLARLEIALAQIAQDPRAATLRTLIAFTSRLNMAGEETLPAQIAAYVSHVLEGSETKLALLLQAHMQAAEEPVPAMPAPPGPTPPAPLTAQIPAHQPAAGHALAQGHVLARTAALEHDLKTLVLSLLRDPPPGRPASLSQALNETLITLTGTQVNAAAANAQNPGTLTIPLPAFFYDGGKPAYLRISRDGAGSRSAMDADNFHVAFLLDTANLGTVAIDVQTSGRAVKVDVKTEAAKAASAFDATLGTLRERLEKLRYRVSSASANVLQNAPPLPVQTAATVPPLPHAQSAQARLDTRA